MADKDKLKDDPPQWLYWLHCKLHAILPLVLVFLLVILTAKLGFGMKHPVLNYGELAVIGYFVSEILVDAYLYENKRVFLKDYWINILLILPFLAAFRLAGRTAQAANAARGLEVFAGTGELTAMSGRLGRASRLFRGLPKAQKMLHLIVDMPKAIKKLKKFRYILPLGLSLTAVWRRAEKDGKNSDKSNPDSDSDSES